jgi:MFS family permease
MTASFQPQAVARQPPNKRAYYHLFFAQVIALLSTGIATVALALLAYQLAGADAGAVMGTALGIKMLAYVVIAPVAAAFAERLPRRALLVILDLVRAAVALMLPFVTQVWQIYLLILVFQAASAAFTPAFQAAIPDLLPDEQDYTRALSRSRIAHEFETLASPALAAGLLLIISFPGLFVGTTIGFLVSAVLILRITLPDAMCTSSAAMLARAIHGLRIFVGTPRLRGLLALNLATAAATAMVTVNTVVLVQAWLGLGERATGLAFVAFGAGSVAGAIAVLKYVPRWSYRRTMLAGGGVAAIGLLAGVVLPGYLTLLALWLGLGLGCALAITPAGSLLLQSAAPEDRQPAYAAQFALSHAGLLLTYPLAGWLGAAAGLPTTFGVFGLIAAAALLAAWRLWPRHDLMAASGIDATRDHGMWRPDGSG